jgi:hypothetical protein
MGSNRVGPAIPSKNGETLKSDRPIRATVWNQPRVGTRKSKNESR